MAGVEMQEQLVLRGRSITPVLKGEATEWDNDFYAEYSTKHQSHTHMRMYRTPQWKLIRDFMNPDRDELYSLTEDPAETNNLIDSEEAEVKKVLEGLDARIRQRMQIIGDGVLQN